LPVAPESTAVKMVVLNKYRLMVLIAFRIPDFFKVNDSLL